MIKALLLGFTTGLTAVCALLLANALAQKLGGAHEAEAAERTEDARIEKALEVALWNDTDEAHHKAWIIDQIVRSLTGELYGEWVKEYENGEDGPHTYLWDIGIAP